MISVLDQVRAFALTIGIGGLIGLFFDLYRAWRFLARPGRLSTCLGDALVWLVLTPSAFLLLFLSNGGELRSYVLLGLVVGFGLHRRWASARTVRFWHKILVLASRGIKLGLLVCLFPYLMGKKILRWPLGVLTMGMWFSGRAGKQVVHRAARGLMAGWRRWKR